MVIKKEIQMNHEFYKSLDLPLIAAPMFLISGPELVIECCKNGIVGTFPALNQRTSEGFEEWVIEIKEALATFEKETGKKAAPFGVNLIVHPTNIRVKADLDICVKHKVPLVITSLGAIADLVNVVHGYGGLVYHDIIKKRHAEKAAEAGVDGLIVVAAGAGGHAGTLHPIPLINEVKKVFDKKIVLSGCLSTGKDIASALQMGADMAYMGTRFINVDESMADEAYKKMIMESSAEDIVYTAAVSGVNASFLRPSLEAMGITEKHWKETKKIDFGSETDAVSEEAKAWKTIWSAGQGVSTISDSVSVSNLIGKLKAEFIAALQNQQALLKEYQ
jgi:nitronate monooxygenase